MSKGFGTDREQDQGGGKGAARRMNPMLETSARSDASRPVIQNNPYSAVPPSIRENKLPAGRAVSSAEPLALQAAAPLKTSVTTMS
jgi:hypothetical protein